MKLKFKSWYFDTLEFFCLFLFSCSLPKEVKSNTRWSIFVKFADKTGTASLPSSDDPAVGDFTVGKLSFLDTNASETKEMAFVQQSKHLSTFELQVDAV